MIGFAPWLFLLVSVWGAWFTSNACRPIATHRRLSVVSFFAGPRGVERLRDITYARAAGLNLKLNVCRRDDRPTGCPVLMQIHGGA